MATKRDRDGDSGLVVEKKTKQTVARPPLYRVLLHNDHYTTREFVVDVLRSVFHKSETEAVQIMLHVHNNGVGVAGVYPFEVAETKIRTVEKLARESDFPLRLSMEPEE
jgi:ATP-dependent Clp protease adaptor protein ClpS